MVERVVGRVDDEFKRVDDFEVASSQSSEQRTDDDRRRGGGIARVLGLDRSPRVVLADAEDRQRMPGVRDIRASVSRFLRSCRKVGAEESHTMLLSGLACSPWLQARRVTTR